MRIEFCCWSILISVVCIVRIAKPFAPGWSSKSNCCFGTHLLTQAQTQTSYCLAIREPNWVLKTDPHPLVSIIKYPPPVIPDRATVKNTSRPTTSILFIHRASTDRLAIGIKPFVPEDSVDFLAETTETPSGEFRCPLEVTAEGGWWDMAVRGLRVKMAGAFE